MLNDQEFLFFFFLTFCGHPHSIWRAGVESELQPQAYTTATATRDLSGVCDLYHSSWQRRIPDPLSEARDQTSIFTDTSWVPFLCATVGTLVRNSWQRFYIHPITSPFAGENARNYCLLAWCYSLSHPCRTTTTQLCWAVSRKLFMQRRATSKHSSFTEEHKSVEDHITLYNTAIPSTLLFDTLRQAGSGESSSPVPQWCCPGTEMTIYLLLLVLWSLDNEEAWKIHTPLNLPQARIVLYSIVGNWVTQGFSHNMSKLWEQSLSYVKCCVVCNSSIRKCCLSLLLHLVVYSFVYINVDLVVIYFFMLL